MTVLVARSNPARLILRSQAAELRRYVSIHSFFTSQGSALLNSPARLRATATPASSPFSTTRRAPFSDPVDPTRSPSTSTRPADPDAGDGNSKGSASTDSKLQQHEPEPLEPSRDRPTQSDSNSPPHSPPDPATVFANYPPSLRELAVRSLSRRAQTSLSERQLAKDEVDPGRTTPPPTAQPSLSLPPPPSTQQLHSHSYRRPTKEDLLRYARGFWTRLRIRFKWFTIRGFRRFNADDLSAFFTLGGLGTIVLVVVGTTTAFSIVLWGLDMLNMQKWIARKIADYLTSQTGVTVVFESAIVPKWKDSRICFQNVFMTRRAQANDPESLRLERDRKRKARLQKERDARSRKRGTASTAGMGMAWEGITWEETGVDDDEVAPPLHPSVTGEALSDEERETVDTNFTMFDLNVDSIDVKLSISRWFEGKGLIEDAVVSGVRGIIDRRNVFWDPSKPYDPRAARRTARAGDFELESLDVSDVLVTIYQPGNFRPFNFSVFHAAVPKLRKQWLFYDLLSAESITGQVDGCLFSLHKPQSMGRTNQKEKEMAANAGRWRTISRLRLDGVNIDHIQSQSGPDLGNGPLSWILCGRFDVVADIRFPRDLADDVDINTIINEIVENLASAVNGGTGGAGTQRRLRLERERERRRRQQEADDDDTTPIPGQHKLNEPAIEAPLTTVGPAAERAWKESIKSTGLNRYDETGREGDASLSQQQDERVRRWRRRLKAALFSSSGDDPPLLEEEDSDEESVMPPTLDMGVEMGQSGQAGDSTESTDVPPPSVVIDLDVRFKDIKAAVPYLHSSLTYSRQAFVRPIVAFMNANRTLIPVHAQVVMDLSEFDGSMDLAQTGLLPMISERLYEALAQHVESESANRDRLKRVSVWSLKSALHVMLGLAKQLRDGVSGGSIINPMLSDIAEESVEPLTSAQSPRGRS
ncbi:unnamed protein product [Parajaminaea phylloscopi]